MPRTTISDTCKYNHIIDKHSVNKYNQNCVGEELYEKCKKIRMFIIKLKLILSYNVKVFTTIQLHQ